MKPPLQPHAVELPIVTLRGRFLASYSTTGLSRLEFPSRPASARVPNRVQRLPREIRRWHQTTCKALQQALRGLEPECLPPLDFSAGTAFQQRVWQTLRQIPLGQTWSYGRVATALGNPGAVRAVGGACGANPIPVFVPCHRVVASGGLGGFSGGLDWKRALLALEGVEIRQDP